MSRGLPPDDPETTRILDLAEGALERGEPESAIAHCQSILESHPDHPGALYLTAEALHDMGEFAQAEARYRRCTQVARDHALSWSGLALALFDQLRFDEANNAANRGLRLDDANAEAYYARALVRERRGDAHGAIRDFRRAYRLEPERYPPPTVLDDATIEAVVSEALLALPSEIRDWLANVPILLEEMPSDEVCRAFDPPRSPAEILLGLFQGHSMMDGEPIAALPPTITLYRKSLERLAFDRQRLLDEVRITLLHEVGHFLGLSEADLEARGLD